MDKRISSYITVGLAWLLLIFLLLRPHAPGSAERSSWIRSSLKTAFEPVLALQGASDETVLGLVEMAAMSKREALAEVRRLRSENVELKSELLQLGESQLENVRLEVLLDLKQQSKWRLKTSRVIGREPSGWWKEVFIDLTAEDGAKPLLPVITSDGLVGRISSVESSYSRVTLLGSPELQIPALAQETRASGVLKMSREDSYSLDILDLDFLKRDSGVQSGHKIVSSGLGGVFPAGIPIGTVLKVSPAMEGLYFQAKVQLLAKTDRLEEVCVILR